MSYLLSYLFLFCLLVLLTFLSSYRMESIADGDRNAKFIVADADAQAIVLKGEADAHVIKNVGEAEANRMGLKADAWKEYPVGAYVEMLVEKLPGIVTQVSGPLASAKDVMFISTGGEDVGASRLTGEVAKIIGQIPPVIESFTGVSLTDTVKRMQTGSKRS